MRPLIDISGKKFGRITAIRYLRNRVGYWLCMCECGATKEIPSFNLRSGGTKSCGCLQRELVGKRMPTLRHGQYKTGTYTSWQSMIARCTRPSHESYPGYGGRGVKICEQWFDFANFYADMGDRPEGTTLDRYPDMNGDYEPKNCRWATPVQQGNNTSRTRRFLFRGEERTLREISDMTGVSMTLLTNRMRKGGGLSIEEAVRKPTRDALVLKQLLGA